MQNLYDSLALIYESMNIQNTLIREPDMTTQTMTQLNALDTQWQIARLQKAARLNRVIQYVVNKRSCN